MTEQPVVKFTVGVVRERGTFALCEFLLSPDQVAQLIATNEVLVKLDPSQVDEIVELAQAYIPPLLENNDDDWSETEQSPEALIAEGEAIEAERRRRS